MSVTINKELNFATFPTSSYGVVVSRSLYTGKVIGSNPVGSNIFVNLSEGR